MRTQYVIPLVVLLIFLFPFSVFSEESFGDIDHILIRLQNEAEQLTNGSLSIMSDELLDELYANWKDIQERAPKGDPNAALEYFLPPYINLNQLLQSEVNTLGDINSLRVIKQTSILANLFPALLRNSKAYIGSLDPQYQEYLNRERGYKQAQMGGANMVVGSMITLFTDELPKGVSEVLQVNLFLFGPEIVKEIDEDYRQQLFDFISDNIDPQVLSPMEGQYREFLELIEY